MSTTPIRSRGMAELVKEGYQKTFGTELGEVFYELQGGWTLALARYEEFRRLFNSAENSQFLTAIGGGFFGDVLHIFWDDLLLRLCRLTDPPKTGQRNLTIQLVARLYKGAGRRKTQREVTAAVEATRFAREHRNRRLAHEDHNLALGRECRPLPATSMEKVKLALDAIHRVLDQLYYRETGNRIDNSVTTVVPGAEALLAYTRQMARAVLYIDSTIDPEGQSPPMDHEIAVSFLRKLGRPLHEVNKIMELRESAERLRGKGTSGPY